MSLVIPFKDFASFEQEVQLDNVPYRILIDYNVMFEYWTISFKDRNLNEIVSGIKLVLSYDLLEQYPGRGLPPGQLFVIDTTGDIDKIDRDNVIEKLALVYIPEDEVE